MERRSIALLAVCLIFSQFLVNSKEFCCSQGTTLFLFFLQEYSKFKIFSLHREFNHVASKPDSN